MRLIPIEGPTKVLKNVTEYVSSVLPEKMQKRLVRALDFGKPSPSAIANGHAVSNGTIPSQKKPGAILDGAIEKRLYPVEFEWTGPGDHVAITGTFYDWTVKIPLNKKSDKFYARIDLPRGRHEFKFVVNGVWKTSLRYPTVQNGYGDLNNFVEV